MELSNLHENDLIISLTIDGTEYEEVEVKVSNPNKSIREQVASIIDVFELPEVDGDDNCIQYLLCLMNNDFDEPEVLEDTTEDGTPLSMMDYNIQTGDALHLFSVSLYACPIPHEMEKELREEQLREATSENDGYNGDYYITLSIDGTEYCDLEVRVTDPNKKLRDQLASIVDLYELPKLDCSGYPIQYLLSMVKNEGEEPDILEFEDEDGREQALVDYNVQPGDHIVVISIPIAGYACPIPVEMQKEWDAIYRQIVLG